jgi:hypothetical protein
LGIKTFESCESSTGYLWKYIVHSGADTDINTAADFREKNKTAAIVVKLIKTLLNKGHTVWMDNYYNSPEFAAFFKLKLMWLEHYASTEKIWPPPHSKKQQAEKRGGNFAT